MDYVWYEAGWKWSCTNQNLIIFYFQNWIGAWVCEFGLGVGSGLGFKYVFYFRSWNRISNLELDSGIGFRLEGKAWLACKCGGCGVLGGGDGSLGLTRKGLQVERR